MTGNRARDARGLRRTALVGALGVAAALALVACSSSSANPSATLPTVFPSSAAAVSSETAVPDSSAVATSEPDPAEVQAYLDAMEPLAAVEQDLLDRYGAVTGANYTDDQTTYDAIVALLPDVQAFITQLESVPVPKGALEAAQADLIAGWNTQSEGMTLVADAIDKQDLAAIATGNTKLAEGRALLRKAQGEVQAALAAS